jgi:6-phosphogluconolactonase
VPPHHEESNYGMVKQTLFPIGILDECEVLRMEGEMLDMEEATRHYEEKLPE